ncbi:MAG: hypothetical protein Q8Q39_01395 [bacterium]|nr:hypothetical protein [bacterium]
MERNRTDKTRMAQMMPLALIMGLGVQLVLPLISAGIKTTFASTLASAPAFTYPFTSNGILRETSAKNDSTSPYWWLQSGGLLTISGGAGNTIQGDLSAADPLRIAYAKKTPGLSDNGFHPQNLFKLLTKSAWENGSQQITATISGQNLYAADNVHPWNALSLISRYRDSTTFYLASLRMDGTAVIKKKTANQYYTLASSKVLAGTYDSIANPSLLPEDKPIVLRSDTETAADGSVTIRFYVDIGKTGSWKLAAEAHDTGSAGGSPITGAGLNGIFGDFMDIRMDDYAITLFAASSTPSPTPTPTPSPSPAPTTLFNDPFSQYADGLITNEFAYWNPTAAGAKQSPLWEMTSGSLYAQDDAGWTGVPDAGTPNADSSNANNSAIFRLTTKQAEFQNVSVSFDLLNQGLVSTNQTPAVAWDGVHVFLRYQNEESLYYASINRRDNSVVVKKKVPGGPSNGGTYYNIGNTKTFTVPYNAWQAVRATIKNNTDGSVTITLSVNGSVILNVTDAGTGGSPIRAGGKSGIRGDNTNLKFKNFKIAPLP